MPLRFVRAPRRVLLFVLVDRFDKVYPTLLERLVLTGANVPVNAVKHHLTANYASWG